MSKMKALLIFLSGIVLLLILFLTIAIYKKGGITPDKTYTNFAKAVSVKLKVPTLGTDETEASLDGVVSDLRRGSFAHVKSDMTFKMKNKADKIEIEKNIKAVRKLIVNYTSTLDSTRLKYPNQRDIYKSNLIKLINRTFGYEIEDIYFRNFILGG